MKLITTIIIVLLLLTSVVSAQTYTFGVLHAFRPSPDGTIPMGTLAFDSTGNLYGTTEGGGRFNYGVVWKLTSGKETILRAFNSKDGGHPMSGLNGSSIYYGTTQTGGGTKCNCGTVFQVVDGVESVLHVFAGKLDGKSPATGVQLDAAGNVYGISLPTESGYGGGVFEISQGVFSIIYPTAVTSVAVDAAGDVFMLEGRNIEQLNAGTLYIFPSNIYPQGLAVSSDGKTLTGITEYGGQGYGSIWQWTQTDGEVDLYQFLQSSVGLQNPTSAVIFDGLGNAFGTFEKSGAAPKQFGTVYQVQLNTSNPPMVLHQFTGLNDGYYPLGNLMLDASGNIYGTATAGGRYQRGTVFELKP